MEIKQMKIDKTKLDISTYWPIKKSIYTHTHTYIHIHTCTYTQENEKKVLVELVDHKLDKHVSVVLLVKTTNIYSTITHKEQQQWQQHLPLWCFTQCIFFASLCIMKDKQEWIRVLPPTLSCPVWCLLGAAPRVFPRERVLHSLRNPQTCSSRPIGWLRKVNSVTVLSWYVLSVATLTVM